MEHHRQDAGGFGGTDDPDADLPGQPARDDPVVDIGGLKLDGDARLNVAQDLAVVLESCHTTQLRGEPSAPGSRGGRSRERREIPNVIGDRYCHALSS